MSQSLPEDIVESIAISNAKSIGERPAILSNLALANEIANVNIAQQNAIANQQAMYQLQMAAVSKCVELIVSIDSNSDKAEKQIELYQKIMEGMVDTFQKLTANPAQSPPPEQTPPDPNPPEPES